MNRDEIRKACEEATPGPWVVSVAIEEGQLADGEWVAYADWNVFRGDPADDDWVLHGQDDRDIVAVSHDVEFIAGARTWVPELLADNDRLRAALREYGEHAYDCDSGCGDYPCTCGLDAALVGESPTTQEGKG